nr:UPF0764 protein C16orf89 homolog isoform X3 [Oryctolagus cuniculus]
MARRGLLLLLLLSALQPLWPSALPPPGTAAGKAAVAGLILSALERATVFLEKRLPEINLDGVVGFRVLAVQLKGVQEEWAQDPPLQPLSLRAGKLVEKLEALLPRSLRYLQLSDPQYLREFRPAVQPGFWKLPHTWTRTNASLVYSTWEPQDLFSEGSSDRCLDGRRPSLQALGPMQDPHDEAGLLGLLPVPPDALLPLGQDVMFCGLAGFSDFYKHRWLEAIVSWQRPQEGCFGKPAATGEAAPRAPQSPQRLLRRVKRQEKEFTDGCLAHQTTTAVAALGGFLYILAEDPGEDGAPPPRAAPEPTVHR